MISTGLTWKRIVAVVSLTLTFGASGCLSGVVGLASVRFSEYESDRVEVETLQISWEMQENCRRRRRRQLTKHIHRAAFTPEQRRGRQLSYLNRFQSCLTEHDERNGTGRPLTC